MHRAPRMRLAVLALPWVVVAVLAVPPAEARPERVPGRIDFVVRLEPPDLAPGGDGVLVVTSVIEHELHLYADGGEAITWKPLEAEGVTYHVPTKKKMTWERFQKEPGKITWNEPTLRGVPGFPNAPKDPVWEVGHDFEIRVPVTIAADAPKDATLGLVFDYSACDEMNCYDRIKKHVASVQLGKSPPVPASDTGAPGGSFVPGPEASDTAARVGLEVKEAKGGGLRAVVTFTPSFGFHLYMPESDGYAVDVEPLEDEGVTWGEWDYPELGAEIKESYAVEIPFKATEAATRIRLEVKWQGCDDIGSCERPGRHTLEALFKKEGAAGRPPETPPMVAPGRPGPGGQAPPPPPPEPAGEGPGTPPQDGAKRLVLPNDKVPFIQIFGDDLDQPRTDGDWVEGEAPVEESEIARRWRESWVLALLLVFGSGVLLSFTPCVLPIIPLTLSVIGGGNPNISKGRLTLLLTVYVLGLTLTYGAAGAVSGALGKAVNLTAAFQIPAVVWGIAIFFLAMAAGMIGIFELQPPAWMERMRGGAQKKSGTIVGSFLLGMLAAVIASPCTGPFVVSLLALVATQGPFIGFVLFGALGLGMGMVFFAAGSLNLLARPGPWMVWVRYGFGVLLFGFALYFLANAGQLDVSETSKIDGTILLFAIGFLGALAAWWAVARHLHRKEGERLEVARMRGAFLSVLLIITTGVVAWLNRPTGGEPGDWIKLRDVAHLKQEVARAVKEHKPVVVDVGASWCKYCKAYEALIVGDPYLKESFERMVRLKIDIEKDQREDLRTAVDLWGQPRMAFFDEKGRIRRAADVTQWFFDESAAELRKRVDFILGGNENARAPDPGR